jgi:hypothetical protein
MLAIIAAQVSIIFNLRPGAATFNMFSSTSLFSQQALRRLMAPEPYATTHSKQ